MDTVITEKRSLLCECKVCSGDKEVKVEAVSTIKSSFYSNEGNFVSISEL